MTQQDFAIEYTFTSRKAGGDDYSAVRKVRAKSAQDAMTAARVQGFAFFGERFTENCTDWRLVAA